MSYQKIVFPEKKELGSITQSIETEIHLGLKIPVDPYVLARKLMSAQKFYAEIPKHQVLLNKGRYFETSIGITEICKEVSELTGIPIQFNNMMVASWTRLEDFVVAMNCLGYYVEIKVDWV